MCTACGFRGRCVYRHAVGGFGERVLVPAGSIHYESAPRCVDWWNHSNDVRAVLFRAVEMANLPELSRPQVWWGPNDTSIRGACYGVSRSTDMVLQCCDDSDCPAARSMIDAVVASVKRASPSFTCASIQVNIGQQGAFKVLVLATLARHSLLTLDRFQEAGAGRPSWPPARFCQVACGTSVMGGSLMAASRSLADVPA